MLQVYRILLAAKNTDHVTPIPLDVQEAGAEELAGVAAGGVAGRGGPLNILLYHLSLFYRYYMIL